MGKSILSEKFLTLFSLPFLVKICSCSFLKFFLGKAILTVSWHLTYYFIAAIPEETDDFDDLNDIMSNSQLNNHFLNLARELDIMEAKTPEDVYKSHLDNVRPAFGSGAVDSARQNLASSFVNGFINTGFGKVSFFFFSC